MKVDFYKHDLSALEMDAILEACQGRILTTGEYTRKAEEALCRYSGLPYAVGLDSCTAALHLALLACGIGPGDEVITTPMTFVATANAVCMVGATPVFVDVEPTTGNIDPARVAEAVTPKTRAILPVHLYGVLCDMKALRDIADRHGLAIIEDAAHCIEGRRDGYGPGDLGDCVCYSFYATKNICSGEGGMLASRNEELAATVRRLSCHGIDRTASDRYGKQYVHWDMVTMGWKYNLDNIRAALIPTQFDRIEQSLARREALCSRYELGLSAIPGVECPTVPDNTRSARHLQTCWVDPASRDDVLLGLQEAGIGVAVNYRAIHLLKFFQDKYAFGVGDFPVAERIGASTVTLPLYTSLAEEQVDYVLETLGNLVS